jgi:hypothetical protein
VLALFADTLSRTIVYGGCSFDVHDTTSSRADMAYFYGGYEVAVAAE